MKFTLSEHNVIGNLLGDVLLLYVKSYERGGIFFLKKIKVKTESTYESLHAE